MSLREAIKPYIDGNGLVAPFRCDPTTRASDNGIMFTSEYYIILKRRGETIPLDYQTYAQRVSSCMLEPGLLSRAPDDRGQEGPDDYYGVLAGVKAMELPSIAQSIINYGWKHKGIFNNAEPGKLTGEAFLIRQPQLIAAAYAAAGRTGILLFPFFLYAALVILTSCMFADKTDTDARRLSWLLIETMKESSLMCRLAAKVWFRRLLKDYGPEGMQAVYRMYYEPGHPFINYIGTGIGTDNRDINLPNKR